MFLEFQFHKRRRGREKKRSHNFGGKRENGRKKIWKGKKGKVKTRLEKISPEAQRVKEKYAHTFKNSHIAYCGKEREKGKNKANSLQSRAVVKTIRLKDQKIKRLNVK